jgi:hypothetical protein
MFKKQKFKFALIKNKHQSYAIQKQIITDYLIVQLYMLVLIFYVKITKQYV